MSYRIISVGGGVGEGCFRQSDPLVASIVDRVESLEEALAEDEVHSRSTLGANVDNNQINPTFSTTNNRVEVTRPDLSVRGHFECNLVKREEKLLHTAIDRPMIEHIHL